MPAVPLLSEGGALFTARLRASSIGALSAKSMTFADPEAAAAHRYIRGRRSPQEALFSQA